jgi:hypothetical protein
MKSVTITALLFTSALAAPYGGPPDAKAPGVPEAVSDLGGLGDLLKGLPVVSGQDGKGIDIQGLLKGLPVVGGKGGLDIQSLLKGLPVVGGKGGLDIQGLLKDLPVIGDAGSTENKAVPTPSA